MVRDVVKSESKTHRYRICVGQSGYSG
jgi:hypothetical protein